MLAPGALARSRAPTVDVLLERPPADVSPDHPMVLALLAAAGRYEPSATSVGRDGASDAVAFLEVGVPAVEFGPRGAGHHGPEEFVEIESLPRYRRALVEFAHLAARAGRPRRRARSGGVSPPAARSPRTGGPATGGCPRRRSRLWLAVAGWTAVGHHRPRRRRGGGRATSTSTTPWRPPAPNTPEAKAARAATRPALPGQPTNILLIGSDARANEGDPGRSDTLILVRMDSRRGFISMLSFPRDLYVPIAGRALDKINAAYSPRHGRDHRTVEQLTGEPVNYYVIIDFTGFAKLVNAVGGVYIDVDRRYYNKNADGGTELRRRSTCSPGTSSSTATTRSTTCATATPTPTYARDARQQQFLSELKRQTKQLGNLTKPHRACRKIFGKNIEINITNPRTFLSLLELAL